MIFAALDEAAQKGELILTTGGMCRWHRRRDGVVVIREILVLPTDRKKGIGRRMIDEVRQLNQGAKILAKCPTKLTSNCFWREIGFKLEATTKETNIWVFQS